MANVINVYTDGACKGNPGGYGGWGWAEFSNKTYIGKEIVFVDCGGCANSTNNKMELEAVIEYLSDAVYGYHYKIHSDSQYVLKGLIKNMHGEILKKSGIYTGWLTGWIKKDYHDVKNSDYWMDLDKIIKIHLSKGSTLEFLHVSAHVGIYGNELADTLANIGITNFKKK